MQMKGTPYAQVLYRDGSSAMTDNTGILNVPAAFVADMLVAGFVPFIAAATGAAAAATAISTVGAGTLTAAGFAGGLINRSGPVAAFTDTTATAAAIISAVPGVPVGGSFNATIVNLSAHVGTLAAGTGVTLAGVTLMPPLSVLEVRVIILTATTVLITGLNVAPISYPLPAKYTTDDGTTQTLTAAMVAGADKVEHESTGGATPSLTTPTAVAMIAGQPNAQVGQTWILRVINTNSGNTTLLAGVGVTINGDAVLATATWAEYLVTVATGTTITMQFIGSGTTT